jgi:hypothetical protein
MRGKMSEYVISVEDAKKYLSTLKDEYLKEKGVNPEKAEGYKMAASIFIDVFKEDLGIENLDWTFWITEYK